MYRALLWKEIREQSAILLALVVLGIALTAAVITFGDKTTGGNGFTLQASTEVPRLIVAALVGAAGIVVGGALFAGERENGTFQYLDTLPGNRWRIWRGKVVVGLPLALGAGLLLLLGGTFLGAFGTGRERWVWVLVGLFVAAGSYAWGAFGSVIGQNTLQACGLGLFSSVVASPVQAGLAALFIGFLEQFRDDRDKESAGIFLLATVLVLAVLSPLLLSYLAFTADDRRRRAVDLTPGLVGAIKGKRQAMAQVRSRGGFRALLWLLWRQQGRLAGIGAVVSLAIGFLALLDLPLLYIWPGLTLLAGVIVGVHGWADEQHKAAIRYWCEQRLPVGRAWLMKVAIGLMIVLGWTILMIVPSIVHAMSRRDFRETYSLAYVFQSPILYSVDDVSSMIALVFLWPVCGFAFGHLAGLLFNKTIVAVSVGLMTAAPAAAIWFPSLVGGHVHGWQVWPVPLLALGTARLVLWAWTADCLGRTRPLATVGFTSVAALAITAFGLFYRAVEVSVIPESDDDLQFAATLPGLDALDSGREVRAALARYHSHEAGGYQRITDVPFADIDEEARNYKLNGINSYTTVLPLVLKYGWPADHPRFDRWMDNEFQNGWDDALHEAVGLPAGGLFQPSTMTLYDVYPTSINDFQPMCSMLLVRGLQQQAAGDPEVYPCNLDAVLTAVRAARLYSVGWVAHRFEFIDAQALRSLDRWLEKLDGRPDLLRQVAAILARHDAESAPANNSWLVQRTVIRSTVTAPSRWAPQVYESQYKSMSHIRDDTGLKSRAETEANLLSFCWTVPWEKERLRRLVGLGNDPKRQKEVLEFAGERAYWFQYYYANSTTNRVATQAACRIAMLKALLRAYEADTGQPAKTLNDLVPKYVNVVPIDPITNEAIAYRVSDGETVEVHDRGRDQASGYAYSDDIRKIIVKPGQGLLWCGGLDVRDESASAKWLRQIGTGTNLSDLSQIVPLRPSQAK